MLRSMLGDDRLTQAVSLSIYKGKSRQETAATKLVSKPLIGLLEMGLVTTG